MYCSPDIISANSCYIDNWALIFPVIITANSLGIFAGFFFSLVVGFFKK